jgi:hypothetical protein
MKIDGKICGAIFRNPEVEAGISYMENEGVVEISLKAHKDSNSTNTFVLSHACAKRLVEQIRLTFDFLDNAT